jgi:hypothetical protein
VRKTIIIRLKSNTSAKHFVPRFINAAKIVGTVPDNWLDDISKELRLVSFPNSAGIVPLSWLDAVSRDTGRNSDGYNIELQYNLSQPISTHTATAKRNFILTKIQISELGQSS